jgi:hypothetical protein
MFFIGPEARPNTSLGKGPRCHARSLRRAEASIYKALVSGHAPTGKFKALLEEFYPNSPKRLKASLFGHSVTVKKSVSDREQD